MKRYQVVATINAKREIMASRRWYEEIDAEIAARWYDGLNLTLRSLSDNPGGWQRSPEFETDHREIRRAIYRSGRKSTYTILFSIEGEIVRIVSVRRSSQRPIEPDDLAG